MIRQAIKQEKNGYHALSIAATNKIIDRCEKNNMQYTSISDNIPVSLILTNKAEIYFKMGKLDLASQTLTEALKKQNNKITEMTILTTKQIKDIIHIMCIVQTQMGTAKLKVRKHTSVWMYQQQLENSQPSAIKI